MGYWGVIYKKRTGTRRWLVKKFVNLTFHFPGIQNLQNGVTEGTHFLDLNEFEKQLKPRLLYLNSVDEI